MTDTSWHTDAYPELRASPPWVMQEMIAAQPELASEMLSDASPAVAALAGEIKDVLAAGRPVTVTGCGTSEHAAHGIAALIAAAADPAQRPLVRARPAFGAALDPVGGLLLAVSHDGGTRATELAEVAARKAGAVVAAITNDASSSVADAAEHVLITPRHDDSWCHTIAYTSALVAGAALAGAAAPPGATRDLLAAAIGHDAAPIAEALAGRRVLLTAGAGLDHITARELALKIAEGARLPTIALELETVLHGQLAGHEPADALVLVAIDPGTGLERLARRVTHVAQAAAAIGIPVAALVSSPFDAALTAELTPGGRLVLGDPRDTAQVDRGLAVLLAGAGALQRLTLDLAHARATNPDLIRREQKTYRDAALAAETDPSW